MKIEYLLIKKQDDFCKTEEQLKALLESNSRVQIEEKILRIDKESFDYAIIRNDVKQSNEVVFQLIIESKQEIEEKAVECLEKADQFVRRVNDQYRAFKINTIWDDVSVWYGKRLYPRIVEAENLLRKIIYLFMNNTLGSSWLKKNSPSEVRESIKNTLGKNNRSEENEEDCLYYADFITLIFFFFNKYPLNSNYQQMIDKLRDKAVLSDEEKMKKLIEEFELKSNWDRYFADKIQIEDFSGKWGTLYSYRNQVAHSKRISRKDYDDAVAILDKVIPAFNECLGHTANVELNEAQTEAIEKVAKDTIASTKVDHGIELGVDMKLLRGSDTILSEGIRGIEWSGLRGFGDGMSMAAGIRGFDGLSKSVILPTCVDTVIDGIMPDAATLSGLGLNTLGKVMGSAQISTCFDSAISSCAKGLFDTDKPEKHDDKE